MKTTNLKLDKFRIAKLTGMKSIKGGAEDNNNKKTFQTCINQTCTCNTETDEPDGPVCINTSQDYIGNTAP